MQDSTLEHDLIECVYTSLAGLSVAVVIVVVVFTDPKEEFCYLLRPFDPLEPVRAASLSQYRENAQQFKSLVKTAGDSPLT